MVNSNPVIAHRGAWKEKGLSENSIASLREAINLKCAGSEFDVYLTADDVLVVNHDPVFYGLPIEKLTYRELLSKKYPNVEAIATAEEYLKEGLRQNTTKLIFELKESEISKNRTLHAAEIAADLVKRLDKNGLVEFISFDFDALKKIKELIPPAKLSYLSERISPEEAKCHNFTGINYHFSVYKKHPSWLTAAQNLGLSVNVWTVNEKDEMIWFLDEGLSYITTDYPYLLLQVWQSR